jgi:hypothetical protein
MRCGLKVSRLNLIELVAALRMPVSFSSAATITGFRLRAASLTFKRKRVPVVV